MTVDIKIKNARLRGRSGKLTILIKDRTILSINSDDAQPAEITIDAKGGLVTESFVVAHLHLDKVCTGEKVDPLALKSYQSNVMKTAEAIKLASAIKDRYTEDDIINRISGILEQAISYGATHIRGFIDVDTKIKLLAMRAALKLKDRFKNRIELQLVAFPQEGLLEYPDSLELIKKAMEMGADVVGGIPWIEKGEDAQRTHIIKLLKIAKEFDAPVAMLVDDSGDVNLKTIDILAEETIRHKLSGKVQACHARAMQFYSKGDLKKTIDLCRSSRISIVSSPHTGPYHAPVDLLSKSGILVALGQDDCDDAYYPYGRCKMTEVAYIASHILRMMTLNDMEDLYDWITKNPAKIMGYEDFSINPGSRANLVVLKEKSVHEAMTNQSEPLFVIHEGELALD